MWLPREKCAGGVWFCPTFRCVSCTTHYARMCACEKGLFGTTFQTTNAAVVAGPQGKSEHTTRYEGRALQARACVSFHGGLYVKSDLRICKRFIINMKSVMAVIDKGSAILSLPVSTLQAPLPLHSLGHANVVCPSVLRATITQQWIEVTCVYVRVRPLECSMMARAGGSSGCECTFRSMCMYVLVVERRMKSACKRRRCLKSRGCTRGASWHVPT
jgi:hypothetical protein